MVTSSRRLVAGLLAALVWSAALRTVPTAAGTRTPTEYDVKAVYLLNFARFVEWPDAGFATATAPFAICVLGSDPFGSTLDETLAGETIAGRNLVTRRIAHPTDATTCQIVFTGASETTRLPAIVDALAGRPVLTVGDETAFTQRGGMISFRLEQSTVRIDVNPEAIRRSGLSMSSQLLRLARIVSAQP
ncbi:MAG: YfiR family protein [Deltaproteobacteria bacterium]|nr:YfiR family protein [Deltaproteobacteria bacterium]